MIAAASYCAERAFHWGQLLHPLCGNGYQSWSGIISDVPEIGILVTVVAVALGWWRKHNCHVHRCWRLQWHLHPDHGHPVCGPHHPDHPMHYKGRVSHVLQPGRHRYS